MVGYDVIKRFVISFFFYLFKVDMVYLLFITLLSSFHIFHYQLDVYNKILFIK
jgi:hypothetical protein